MTNIKFNIKETIILNIQMRFNPKWYLLPKYLPMGNHRSSLLLICIYGLHWKPSFILTWIYRQALHWHRSCEEKEALHQALLLVLKLTVQLPFELSYQLVIFSLFSSNLLLNELYRSEALIDYRWHWPA